MLAIVDWLLWGASFAALTFALQAYHAGADGPAGASPGGRLRHRLCHRFRQPDHPQRDRACAKAPSTCCWPRSWAAAPSPSSPLPCASGLRWANCSPPASVLSCCANSICPRRRSRALVESTSGCGAMTLTRTLRCSYCLSWPVLACVSFCSTARASGMTKASRQPSRSAAWSN